MSLRDNMYNWKLKSKRVAFHAKRTADFVCISHAQAHTSMADALSMCYI